MIAILAWNLVRILTMLDGFVRNPDFPIFAGIPDFSPIFKFTNFPDFHICLHDCWRHQKKCICYQKCILDITMLNEFVTNPDLPIFAAIPRFFPDFPNSRDFPDFWWRHQKNADVIKNILHFFFHYMIMNITAKFHRNSLHISRDIRGGSNWPPPSQISEKKAQSG